MEDIAKIGQADKQGVLPNGELETEKYMQEIRYWSPPNLPSFKCPKKKKQPKKNKEARKKLKLDLPKRVEEKLPTLQGGCLTVLSPPHNSQVMEPIGLDKFKKDSVVELPPEVDERGECSEVQVLEEFDPDAFLRQVFSPEPVCPRCRVPMQYGRTGRTDPPLLQDPRPRSFPMSMRQVIGPRHVPFPGQPR